MLAAPGNPNDIYVATGDAGFVWGCPIDGNDNCLWIAKPDGGSKQVLPLAGSATALYTT